MTSPTLSGNTTLQELPPRREYQDGQGWRAVRRWRGLRPDLELFANALICPGVQLSIDPETDSPLATLEARFPDAQDGAEEDSLITTWGFTANVLEQDNTSLESLSENDAGEIRYKESLAEEDGNYSQFFGTFANPDAEALFKLRAKGTTTRVVAQFVLRKTTSVPADYEGQFSDRLNQAFTRDQLLTYEETIPAAILVEMPEGEYLKVNLNKEEQSDGRVNVTVEYWHAATWAFYYTHATLP